MGRRLREGVLWLGAGIGVLCAAWTATMLVFGLTPLVVVSGSMSPAIDAGDLVVARAVDASELEVGDVVSVESSDDVLVTHRIVDIEPGGSGVRLRLQGDANAAVDAETYEVARADRMVATIPWAGHLVHAAGSPLAAVAGIALLGGAFAAAFVPARGTARRRHAAARRPRRRIGRAGVVVAVALAVVGGLGAPRLTSAAFTDTGAVSSPGDGLAAAQGPLAPARMGCSGSWGTVTLTYGNPEGMPAPYGYVVEVADNAGFSGARTLVAAPDPGPTTSFVMNGPGLGGWFSGLNWHVRVRAAYLDEAGKPTWTSPDYREWTVSRAIILGTFSCGSQVA